jgi:hypothetical protein
MNTGAEHMSVEFHSRATDLFFALFRDFQLAIKKVDRRHDEYLFHQLQERYVKTCQQQMEIIAREILNNHRDHPGVNQADQNMKHFIQDYLHQFVQKIKSI